MIIQIGRALIKVIHISVFIPAFRYVIRIMWQLSIQMKTKFLCSSESTLSVQSGIIKYAVCIFNLKFDYNMLDNLASKWLICKRCAYQLAVITTLTIAVRWRTWSSLSVKLANFSKLCFKLLVLKRNESNKKINLW